MGALLAGFNLLDDLGSEAEKGVGHVARTLIETVKLAFFLSAIYFCVYAVGLVIAP